GLSAGRVQSVAVRLVCDREAEIQAFKPEEYWSLTAVLSPVGDRSAAFEAKYHGPAGEAAGHKAAPGGNGRPDAGDRQRIPSQEAMHRLLDSLHGVGYRVVDVRRRERRRNPSPPFTTSTLQQEAARKLGFTARRTMRTAQQLYEGLELRGEGTVGLITYMRTDSTRVSPQAVAEAAALIRERYDEDFAAPRSFARQREGAQDAHEAIRPTSVRRLPDEIKDDLTADQYRLYRLIWDRFLASQMSPAVYDTVTADIGAGPHLFRATGSTLKFAGFTVVYIEGRDEESSDDEGALPPLQPGQVLELHDLVPRQHFTQPPPRYSEAMLVKALEEHGIGRPSTYAPIIETIQERGYVTKEDRRFKPTELGTAVTELLKEHFPDIVDIEFTARMESELDRVEEGTRPWREVLQEFHEAFEPMLEKADREAGRVELSVEETDEACEVCGRRLVIKHGRYGRFLACPGYPECRFTKPLLEKTGATCPECGGEVVVRRSRKGRTFYGCANYPDCRFVAWYPPTSQACPRCGAFMMERRTRSRGAYLQCSRESCGHTQDPPAKGSGTEAAGDGAAGGRGKGRRRSAPSAAEREMARVAGAVVRSGGRPQGEPDG
ncbi:MAG TPA: type I DNA topoisomerase, partial [Bacillota bacterium]